MAKPLSKQKDNYLKKIYFDSKSPVSYSGLQRVWNFIKNEGVVSRSELRHWLKSQDTYTSYHPYKRKFRRPRVVVANVDDVWGTDVAYMIPYEKQNDGYAFFVVFIDIASRYAWAYPIKTLKGIEMTAVLRQVFENAQPQQLFSDQGSEYKNRWVSTYLKSQDIEHYYSLNEKKVAHAERLIKEIKLKLSKYMSENNTAAWISVLDDFVNNHNNSYHRSIGMTPSQARNADSYTLWVNRYFPKPTTRRKAKRPTNKSIYRYKVGDRVKLLAEKKPFDRAYNPRFTTEVFTITDRRVQDNVPMYSVKDELNERIVGRFYEPELTSVVYNPDKSYKIEKVLKRRTINGVKQAFVKWLNYPSRYNSWVSDIEYI